MSEQTPDVKKSIETVVEQILEQEKRQEAPAAAVIEKSVESTEANGGAIAQLEDPSAPAKVEAAAPVADEVVKAKDDDKDEDKDDDKDDKKKKAKKDDKKDDKDDKKMPAFMKKSIEELSEVLDEEELELIKAWRDESAAEEITKSQEAPATEEKTEEKNEGEDLVKAIEAQLAPLKKSLDEKDSLIKSMSDKIEKMASQPAYDRRSISTLESLEKSGSEQAETLSKSQVAEKMLGMQLAGKGVTSHHISEFEATGNISDPLVKALVFKELKLS